MYFVISLLLAAMLCLIGGPMAITSPVAGLSVIAVAAITVIAGAILTFKREDY